MNRGLDCFALTLVIIGAVNWGLIGFFQLDLVAWLFGNLSWISRINLCTGRFMRTLYDLVLRSFVRRVDTLCLAIFFVLWYTDEEIGVEGVQENGSQYNR